MNVPRSIGCASRVRAWWAGIVAGEHPDIPEAALSKVRLLESIGLPLVARLIGLGPVRSLADLLPADDVDMTVVLQGLHEWSGRMLDDSAELARQPRLSLSPATPTTPVDDDVDESATRIDDRSSGEGEA